MSASNDSPGQALFPHEIDARPDHQRPRHRQQDAGSQRPFVEAAEHSHAALARNLQRLFAEYFRDEGGHPRILGVETVRSDVEVEVAVVPGAAESADGVVRLEDGDVVARARQAGPRASGRPRRRRQW